MNISFDFDDTLEQETFQQLAKHFIKRGDNVCIITTRHRNNINSDLFAVAERLGIKAFFTNGKSKIDLILEHTIDLHFEDCPFEIEELKNVCDVIHVEPLKECE